MEEWISESCRICRKTFNVGQSCWRTLRYIQLQLYFNSLLTLFYKLKLAIIYLRISKLNCDWLIQRFWNRTKNKEIALVCGKRRFGLGQKMVKIISTTYNLIGIAVSAVPKSHAHVLTLGKLTLLFTNPNQQIFWRITKTDQQLFLAMFLVVQPWRVNPACQMPPQCSLD